MRLLSNSKFSKLCQVISLSLFSLPLLANEQPDASIFVGQSYIGGHGIYLEADNDRLFSEDKHSEIAHGSGIGAEYGHRLSPSYEARISYSNLNINTQHKGYDVEDGSSVALDMLYFPYQKSLYLVAGADFLDIDKSNLSADLGAGYRYFINDNAAFYIEGKGHYQIDDNYTDFSSKIGFIYYFDTNTPKPTHAKTSSPTAKKVTKTLPKDSDKDGVVDSQDNCANTPFTHKVNAQGCTVYMKQRETFELLVNFDNDKSDINAEGKKEITKMADFLQRYRQTRLTVHGHTSAQGDANYNQKLSERRAQAIVNMLVNDFSIAANRLTAIGHGEQQLKNSANTASAHAVNRRIEATITGAQKVPVKR
ncbi:porin [Thalassotalea insulae]|uniref:Porin n=1 Tax=Thalassotalea insulae TaxID=2056778 RepID=A0ABQ6GTI9_9GAMM|nr:OmpA family protein [Thalassotalea insulae]GLX77770.1 porin [Thalassotalea insulae]